MWNLYKSILIYHNEIDQLISKKSLERQERVAKTRKVTVNMEFIELEINYFNFKSFIFSTFIYFQFILYFLTKVITNKRRFDFMYFRIINLLLVIYIKDIILISRLKLSS